MHAKLRLRSVVAVTAVAAIGLASAPSRSAAAAACGPIEPGVGASLQGRRPFPDDNPWNRPVSGEPVDPNSDNLLASIGLDAPLLPDFGSGLWNGGPIGVPYVVVPQDQPEVPVTFTRSGHESDPGPYPVPLDAPIQGGGHASGDRHVVVVQCTPEPPTYLGRLFELYRATPRADGSWRAASGAVFDLGSNDLRPAGWTSADAAGLPIFPGLVRYDEAAERGEIRHALRFTAPHTRRAYVPPARHWASDATDPNLPPMGMRVRLKADYDISRFPPRMQVILRALQEYGMILADHGGFALSGAPDERWDNQEIRTLRRLTPRDFEVVEMRGVVTR